MSRIIDSHRMQRIILYLAVLGATLSLAAQQKSPTEQLEAAIYANDAAKVTAAVKAGANPNGGTYGGHYLGIAATHNYDKAVKALVEAGADVNRSSSGGWTAVMAAADNGHLEVLKYLVSKKADLNARTRQGRTPLMRASYHGKTEVAQYLIAQGAKVNDTDSNGVTALMLAAQAGHLETCRVLVNAGAKKDAATQDKRTALTLVKDILKEDAKNGITAKDSFRQKRWQPIVTLLSGAEKPEKKALGKLVGKVFSADGKKLVITGKGIADLGVGQKLKIKTSAGEIAATVKEVLHSKVKATAAKAGAEKGDAVHLDK